MSKYTKANLESMNKGQVVEVALNLAAQVDAASGAPLTSAELEKKMLDLATQAATIKSNSDKALQAHKEKLAQIEASFQKDVKTLELQYESTSSLSVVELNEAYASIKVKAEEAIKNLSYGLKEAEIEAKGKLAKIAEKVESAQAEYDQTIAGFKASIDSEKSAKAEEITKIKTAHDRTVEQLTYDNKISIRDDNEKVANAIAKSLGKELIASDELAELKDVKQTTAEELAETIEAAVNEASSKIYATERSKYSKLESESKNEVALLKNDKAHLLDTVDSQKLRIVDLEDRLKDVPAQIAAAVQAAKANVAVTQTGSGK